MCSLHHGVKLDKQQGSVVRGLMAVLIYGKNTHSRRNLHMYRAYS